MLQRVERIGDGLITARRQLVSPPTSILCQADTAADVLIMAVIVSQADFTVRQSVDWQPRRIPGVGRKFQLDR